MIIADPNGGYLNRWYQPHTDDVLNPFDPLSVQWDLFKEIRKPSDYDALAQALIVGQARTEMVWINYARVFLATLLRRCHRAHLIQLSQLLHLVQSAPLDDLRLLLKDSPVSPFLESGNERMFASIRSVCMSALNSLQYLPEPQDQGFSVRSFVLSDRRALFLPYQADQIASLRSLISTWLRLAIETLLSRGESDDPVWIVVDELDALGAIDGLKDALVRLRKHGGRCVLGFQSIGQLVGTYGEHDAKTIGENCGNTLILRCSGSGSGGTARYAQEQVGDRQVLRQHINTTRPKRLGGFWSRSESVAWQRTIEPALLASEIEQLPDLQGFVKCASDAYWRRVILSLP
jgi:type IV secretory pathway TraG/TraD family ATPase VirD4